MSVEKTKDAEQTTPIEAESGPVKILAIPWRWYLVLVAVGLAAVYTNTLPENIFGGLAISMILGCGLFWLGDRTPALSAVGGGPLLCVFAPAAAVYFGAVPDSFVTVIKNWFTGYGFVEILVASIIVGSILGMDRRFLIKAGGRFCLVIVVSFGAVVSIIGAIAAATGFGFRTAIMEVTIPIMAGGISGGAIPLSQMYADKIGGDPQSFMSTIVPPIICANLLCIVLASVYANLTRRRTKLFYGFNGHGQMLRVKATADEIKAVTPDSRRLTVANLGTGIVITAAVYLIGAMMQALVPAVHLYAWVIVLTAVIKIVGILPDDVEESATEWYGFVVKLWVPAALVGIGVSLIDIDQIAELATRPAYLAFTVATVLITAVIAGFVGWLLRLYFVESSITAGLCMTDLGGSGDIATLGTTRRMHLLPFAQITSRLGGGLVLLTASGFLAYFYS
ncbi:2-hydroxycarboxylate transporter family protein [Rhodococcoides kyotonense]|uniref:Na+/citrate or Na+/malate symporter n=1 Tax=Rhodococcoides kyotonense TaxID=398843 RepID=A0A239NF15_9NOCA|nr:2-hydroxycarboxylate transporter family protein [Rhodococcus kyotonensis]SNT53350.1 Na+/citrate or Na+/malate symporter [Rhodococcus kyotonensis]